MGIYETSTNYNDMQKVHAGDVAIAIDIGAKLISVGFIMAVAAYQTKTLQQALIWGMIGAVLLMLSYWVLKTFVWKDIETQLGNNNIAIGHFRLVNIHFSHANHLLQHFLTAENASTRRQAQACRLSLFFVANRYNLVSNYYLSIMPWDQLNIPLGKYAYTPESRNTYSSFAYSFPKRGD